MKPVTFPMLNHYQSRCCIIYQKSPHESINVVLWSQEFTRGYTQWNIWQTHTLEMKPFHFWVTNKSLWQYVETWSSDLFCYMTLNISNKHHHIKPHPHSHRERIIHITVCSLASLSTLVYITYECIGSLWWLENKTVIEFLCIMLKVTWICFKSWLAVPVCVSLVLSVTGLRSVHQLLSVVLCRCPSLLSVPLWWCGASFVSHLWPQQVCFSAHNPSPVGASV